MTQLALLLALGLIGLLLAFALGRLEVKRSSISPTLKRAEGALERAAVGVLRLGAARGLGLLVVPALGLSGFALVGKLPGSVSSGGRAAFFVVALLAGGALALVQARFALGLGTRAASSAATALARGSALALRPLLRGSLAIAIFGEGLGLLGVAAAFATLYAVRGGFAAPEPNAQLACEVLKLLPAFALGAAITSLAIAREGSVAATAARVGSSQGIQLDAPLEAGDARDPALLAELVGHLAGELLPRALTSYVCGLTATVSAALLVATGSLSGVSTLACLVLVVLVRAFGALGSVCGVFAARVTDEEPPAAAIWRGLGSAFVVALFGLGAALFWLERPYLAPLFAAGALGLATMTFVAQAAWLPLRRGSARARELLDARGSGEAATIVRGASAGLSGLWPALLLPALALTLLERTLSSSVPAGLVLITFAAGALALGPFALAISGFGLLAAHTRGVAALARLELEPPRRLAKLDDASALGAIAGSTQASLALALSSLLGLLSLSGSGGSNVESSFGLAALTTALGAALVPLFGARTARSAALGSRLVTLEVERQLREFPRQQGVATVPADFTPSYKSCVEAALSAARDASLLDLGALLLAPFLLGSLLHWSGAGLGRPLSSFGVAFIVAGLIFALGGRATRAMLGDLRRRLRGSDAGLPPAVAGQAESFGDLVGVTAASSVEALALVQALTVLCLAPLLR